MFRRKTAAVVLALLLGATASACGTDDTGAPETEGGPGQSTEEDPTLGDPEGGGTPDGANNTEGQTRSDGGDEGTTPNSVTDSGSGTGAGRGDG